MDDGVHHGFLANQLVNRFQTDNRIVLWLVGLLHMYPQPKISKRQASSSGLASFSGSSPSPLAHRGRIRDWVVQGPDRHMSTLGPNLDLVSSGSTPTKIPSNRSSSKNLCNGCHNQIPPMRHRTTIVSRAAMSSFFGDDMFFLGIEISDTCGFSFATDRSAEVCSVKKSEKIVNFSSKTCGISFFSRGFNFNSNTYLLRGNSLQIAQDDRIFVQFSTR